MLPPTLFKTTVFAAHQLQKGIRNSILRRTDPQQYMLHDRSHRQEIFRHGMMSVQYYPPLTESEIDIEGEKIPVSAQRHPIPLVFVPPLGVYAWIFDLMTERSLVRYFLAKGFSVYLIDWGVPKKNDVDLSLETYTLDWFPKAIGAIQQHSQQPSVSLFGYCMGGLLALIYTAARGEHTVKNLITIASPINAYQALSGLGRLALVTSIPTGIIRRLTGSTLQQLNPSLFHIRGRLLSMMFKATAPMATVTSYLDLIRNLADSHYVSRYMTMNEWFNRMPDYPGATVLEVIEKLGLANSLAQGSFKLGAEEVHLNRIQVPLLSIAGSSDVICTVGAASPVMSVVSSLDRTFHVVAGGHAGVFTGSHASHSTWLIVSDWLKKRPAVRDAMT